MLAPLAPILAQGDLLARACKTVITYAEIDGDVREVLPRFARRWGFALSVVSDGTRRVSLTDWSVSFLDLLKRAADQTGSVVRVEGGRFVLFPASAVFRSNAVDPGIVAAYRERALKESPFTLEWVARRGANPTPWAEVVVASGGAYYRDRWTKAGGAWSLAAHDRTTPEASRNFENVPVADATRALFAGTGTRWACGVDGTVTVDLTGLPLDAAVDRLAARLGGKIRKENGEVWIVPQDSPIDTGEIAFDAVEFNGTEARDAIRALFARDGFAVTVDSDVVGRVWGHYYGVPFETILQNLTRQVEATYRVEGGVYQVVLREDPEFFPLTRLNGDGAVSTSHREPPSAIVRHRSP